VQKNNFMIRILSAIFIIALISSCGSEKSTAFSESQDTTLVLIRPSYILKINEVSSLVPSPRQEEKATWCTEQSYKLEDSDPAMAIHYQIKAITYHPTSTRYIRLAKLYSKKSDYCNASEAYQFIFRSFPDGNREMLYDLLYCTLMGNCNDNLYFIKSIAGDKEINITDLITQAESDERFAQAMKSYSYDKRKKSLLQYYDCGDTISFTQYLTYFDPAKFPYTINDSNVGKAATEVNDGMDCDINVDTFLAGNITNWTKYDMLAVIRKNSSGITVIYEGDSSNYEDRKDLKTTFYKIVSYTNSGTILCDTTVAWRIGATERHCTISSDLTVTTEDFERVFKRPYDQKDRENELLEVKPTSTGSFRIDPSTGCFIPAP
jgi:hypothetical protein